MLIISKKIFPKNGCAYCGNTNDDKFTYLGDYFCPKNRRGARYVESVRCDACQKLNRRYVYRTWKEELGCIHHEYRKFEILS